MMTSTPEPSRLPPPPPSTAVEFAADVLLLLKKGRTKVALAQLEKLPELIQTELLERVGGAAWHAFRDGYERGQQDLAREIAGAAQTTAPNFPTAGSSQPQTSRRHEVLSCRPKRTTNAEWLAQRIADPELRERAKQILRIDDALLDRVLEGRVQLSPDQRRRLRRELAP